MAICGRAIGARQGFIYMRAEYSRAAERLKLAARQAADAGLLGEDILGSGFGFGIEIRLGEGVFACGEETALLRSIEEGQSRMPRPKPPFPAQSGLWGKPTVVGNVETLANIPLILSNGAEWFGQIGIEDSKGTKVFALGGKVNRPGVVEAAMGTTLRELVFELGGGIKGGKRFKAAQVGGPLGGILAEKDLDAPLDFGSLERLEAALRTAHYVIAGAGLPSVSFAPAHGLKVVKEAKIGIKGQEVRIAVVHQIGNVVPIIEKVLDAKARGEEPPYHFIEVMACRGGCVGGGGQPYGATDNVRRLRATGLYTDDEQCDVRCARQNADVLQAYSEFLGEPLGAKARELLHTSYTERRHK